MHTNLVVVFSVVLLLTCILLSSAEEWSHSISLNGNGTVHVHWRVDDDVITFKVEARTKGYVGFGLSKTGGMRGSDIVTGWIADGQVFFQDRYATDNIMPVVDANQDWELLAGQENDTHTVLKFRRKLNTCDDQDMEINESNLRLIYAYSDIDPPTEGSLQYHYANRGSKSVMLLQPKRKKDIPTQDVRYWDILSPNYTVSSSERSAYFCKYFKGPELITKHHIIKIEPYLAPRGGDFVHHILLYECIDADPTQMERLINEPGHYCYQENMPDDNKRCEGVIAAWGVGGEAIIFPENVGLPLEANQPEYYLLEIHYDNSIHADGVTDWSGLRFHYTPHLRALDGGTLMIGSVVSPRVFIPPRQEAFTVVGHAHPQCFQGSMPLDGIKAMGLILHAHLLGRQLKARHFRGEVELKPLAENNNYDFNYQEYVLFPEEISILPGDQISMECTYNSMDRDKVTFNGLSTNEEMCLAFILYYPRIERFGCMSGPNMTYISEATGLNVTNDVLSVEYYNYIQDLNWTSVNVQALDLAVKLSPHLTFCYTGDGDKTSVQEASSYPSKYKPYIKDDTCRNSPQHKSLQTSTSIGNNHEASLLLTSVYVIVIVTLSMKS